MALAERLALLITLDSRGAVKGFESVGKAADKNLGKSTQKMDMLGRSFTTAGVGMVATGAVLAGGLFKMAKASEEAQLSVTKLENSLANNSGLAGATADEFVALSQAIQGKTAADGDNIVAGIAVLAQGKANAAQIKELTPLVVDLARKKGIDEVAAFTLASKAVNGNAGALKRAGIVVDESAFKTDAYGATVEALRSSVGGFAESEGKTFAGSIERLKNEMGDLAEGVGVGVVDAFTQMLGVVDPLVSSFTGLDPAIQGTIGKVASFGAAGLLVAGTASTLIGSLIKMRSNFGAAAGGISQLIGKLTALKFAMAGTVVGLAAVAATIGVAVWKQSQQGAELTRNEMERLRVQAEATGESFDQLTLKNMAADFASLHGITFFETLGTDVASAGAAILGTDEQYAAFLDGLEGGNVLVEAATLKFDSYRDSIRGSEEGVKALADNQRELGLETDGATDATDGLTGELEVEKTAAEDAADALNTLSNAIRNQFTEINKGINAEFDYTDALQDLTEGLKNNGLAFEGATEGGKENRDNLLRMQTTLGGVIAQKLEETHSQEQATAAGELYLENIKNQMRQAGLTEKKIAELITRYGLVVSPDPIEITAETREAWKKVDLLESKIREFINAPKVIRISYDVDPNTGLFRNLPFGGKAPPAPPANPYGLKPDDIDIFKEHGGPVVGGMPYIVGERGPELFVPKQSGQIIPNGAGGTASSAAGTNSQTIIVKIGDEVLARVVANAVATGNRRGVG